MGGWASRGRRCNRRHCSRRPCNRRRCNRRNCNRRLGGGCSCRGRRVHGSSRGMRIGGAIHVDGDERVWWGKGRRLFEEQVAGGHRSAMESQGGRCALIGGAMVVVS